MNGSQEENAKILLSQQNYKTAVAVSSAIKSAGIKVDDLTVAFAGGTAYLSGLTTHEAEIEKAVAVARKQPGVENAGSSILVLTEEQHQGWLNSEEDED